MSDEWSLKYKCKIIMEYREYGEFAGFELLEESDGDVFKVEDIEVLRQKLIEDFKEKNDWLVINGILDLDTIKKMINKRFGVKE